jgi:hypothetical protein
VYQFFKWHLDLLILMRENPLLGPLEGVCPENIDFFWPKWQLSSLDAISGPEKF